MSVTKRVRYEVIRRDGSRCRYCGRSVDDGAKLTVDHVKPVALGGSDDPTNLVAACLDCNIGKASVGPSDELVGQVADDAFRWARAMQMAAELADQRADQTLAVLDAFEEAWDRWRTSDQRPIPRPRNWDVSVKSWVKAGLRTKDLVDLIPAAMRDGIAHDGRWRYYCGCAWKLVRERQDVAEAILAGEPA